MTGFTREPTMWEPVMVVVLTGLICNGCLIVRRKNTIYDPCCTFSFKKTTK